MRDCKVHKVLFYEPEVRAIHSMAIDDTYSQLALSRSDGTVEVWSVWGTPYLQRVMYADSVESLAWSKQRLFSAGLHGSVLEFDLLNLCIMHTVPLVGGPVWCIAVDYANTMLAAGTEEGHVNVLELTQGGAPQQLRLLDKQEGRVLCLAWHPDGRRLVTGSTDALRLWDVKTGRGTLRMTVARSSRGVETTVWFVGVTSDGFAVAGDSRGVVSVWDLGAGVLAQEITTHGAPVLAVALNRENDAIYCAGADPVIACLQPTSVRGHYARVVDRRLHEHDVRALACGGANARLFSGGVDGHLGDSRYPPKTLCKYPPLPHDTVSLSRARFVLLQHTRHVEIWALGAKQSDTEPASGCRLLLRLESQRKEHVTCAAISDDATYVAYATPSATRVLSLCAAHDSVSVTGSWACPGGGALALAFCPAAPARLALVNRAGQLLVLALGGRPQPVVKVDMRADGLLLDTPWLLSFSACGARVAVSDLSGAVASFSAADGAALASLPAHNCAATALAHGKNELLAVYADFKVVELSLSHGFVTPFSLACDEVYRSLPRNRIVTRAAWDPLRPRHLLLADAEAIYGVAPPTNNREAKKSRGGQVPLNRVAQLARYKFAAFVDWLTANELVVVETTPEALQRSLPAALRKAQFATK